MQEGHEITSLAQMWSEIRSHIVILGIAGLIGAVIRALLAPEEKWKRRLAQGLAGFLCAIVFGPLVAHGMMNLVASEVYSLLASGALCGLSGEGLVSFIQKKVYKDAPRS